MYQEIEKMIIDAESMALGLNRKESLDLDIPLKSKYYFAINPAIEYRKPSSSLVGDQTAQYIESKERFRTSRNDNIQVFNCRFNN